MLQWYNKVCETQAPSDLMQWYNKVCETQAPNDYVRDGRTIVPSILLWI